MTLLAAVLSLTLAAPAPAAAPVKNPDTLVYTLIGDVDSLDPAWQYDGISHEILYHLYETLIFYKGPSTSEFMPLLAREVPSKANGGVSKDGLTYTFKIRPNVRFHDGSPLTPEDARYSLIRFMLTDRASGPSALLLEPILGAATVSGEDGKARPELFKEADQRVRVDGDKLVIKLKKPSSVLIPVLAAFCPIVSKSWVISQGGWDGTEATWLKHHNPSKQDATLYQRANGTGPFKLERWDKEQKQLVLARHDGYWRAPAKLKRLVFKTVSEASTRKLMLSGGDADAAIWERPNLSQIASVPGVKVVDDLPFLEVHNAFIMGFKINVEANPFVGSGKLDGEGIPPDFFADKDVRRAFAHAFDYEGYIKDGYGGKGARANGPIPRGVLGHNPKQPVHAFDLKKAEALFRKARGGEVWEKGFRFSIAFMEGRSDRQLACQILKTQVEKLNPKFRIDVRPIQWSTYLSMFAARKLPMANARWALDFADPHNGVHPFLHSQGHYAKAQGYANPRADELVEKAAAETDPAARRRLYHELQAIAHEDVPQIYTLDTYYFYVTRDWVKGWFHNPIVPYGYLYGTYKR